MVGASSSPPAISGQSSAAWLVCVHWSAWFGPSTYARDPPCSSIFICSQVGRLPEEFIRNPGHRLVSINGGSTVVTGSTATIDSASLSHVSYTPSSSHVDTAGTFAMYFIDGSTDAATPQVRYPYDGAKFLLNIVSEDAV